MQAAAANSGPGSDLGPGADLATGLNTRPGPVKSLLGSGAKAVSLCLGLVVIGLAAAVALTETEVSGILAWSDRIFGGLFLSVFCGLAYVAVLSLVKISGNPASAPGVRSWFEAGVQSANAIATLALTYTLLGISLGIGSLAQHELGPDTIQAVIGGLTENFSMAFMTTVVGLPVSAVLRAALLVSYSRAQERGPTPHPNVNGE